MTIQASATLDMLRLRVERVSAVSALTAEAMRLAQAVSGIEMDVLRLELEIARNSADPRLVQELRDTEDSAATIRQAQAECAEAIAAAEEDVVALDRLIAAAKGG